MDWASRMPPSALGNREGGGLAEGQAFLFRDVEEMRGDRGGGNAAQVERWQRLMMVGRIFCGSVGRR